MPGSDSVTWFDVTEVTETEVGDYGTYQLSGTYCTLLHIYMVNGNS